MERASLDLAFSVSSVRLSYGRAPRRFHALRGIDLELRPGEIVGLIGPNGAGKTSLMRLLTGLLLPSEGRILVLGGSPASPRVRNRLGYLPENPVFRYPGSGRSFLNFSGALSGLDPVASRERAEHLAAQLGFSDRLDAPLRGYSRGEAEKLGLIQAFLHRPRLVLLDEPTGGLDPESVVRLRELLRNAASEGAAILLSSHHLTEVERTCHRVSFVFGGVVRREVRLAGSEDNDQRGVDLEDLYLDLARSQA